MGSAAVFILTVLVMKEKEQETEGIIQFGDSVTVIKSDDGTFKVGGYLVRFTSPDEPDLAGEYFTSATNFGPNKSLPVFYNHGFDQTLKYTSIGNGTIKTDEAGLWFEAQLAISEAWEERVKKLIEMGKVYFSSGPLAHMVEYEPAGKSTRIKTWVIAEASLTPQPAEPRNRIAQIKSLIETEGSMKAISLTQKIDDIQKAFRDAFSTQGAREDYYYWVAEVYDEYIIAEYKEKYYQISYTESDGSFTFAVMTDWVEVERQQTWVVAKAAYLKSLEKKEPDAKPEPEAEAVSPEVSRPDTTAKTASEGAVGAKQHKSTQRDGAMDDDKKEPQVPDIGKLVQDAVAAAFKAHKPDVEPDFQVPTAQPAKFSNLWKYDNCDTGDLAFAVGVLNAHHQNGKIPAPETAMKSLAVRLAESTDAKHRQAQYAMKSLGMPMKADELNNSTLASYGDEWAGVAYSNQLWESIRQDTPIVGRIPTMEVPQGSESVTIPLESTPPTFYKVAAADDMAANPGAVSSKFTASRLGTANQSLTVGKLGAHTIWNGEMDEDSVVNFAAELRGSIQREGVSVLEALFIDGDTATGASTNINDIAGTPAGTESFLVANGARKLALVTNTANSRDGGALAVEDFLETLKLMGLAGKNALQRDQVAFILDLWTHWKTLELSEVKTRDVYSAPTIESGMLKNIFGYDVFATSNMHRANQDATYGLKANSSGKIDLDTASNNTTGSILAIRFDQWRLGFKRRMRIETERIIDADATRIVAHMRIGIIYRDTDASAISYNLTL